MRIRTLFFAIVLGLFSCTDKQVKTNQSEVIVKEPTPADTTNSLFSFSVTKDTVQNGEEVKQYKSGKIQMRGMRKDGARTGLWKSWYEDGTAWSETTFENGKKNGRTTTWYENGKKRYEGFYTNDQESGKWTFWDEKGNLIQTKDFGNK